MHVLHVQYVDINKDILVISQYVFAKGKSAAAEVKRDKRFASLPAFK